MTLIELRDELTGLLRDGAPAGLPVVALRPHDIQPTDDEVEDDVDRVRATRIAGRWVDVTLFLEEQEDNDAEV